MNDTPLILIIAHRSGDHEHTLSEAVKAAGHYVFEWVEQQDGFLQALQQHRPQVVLFDGSLPVMDAFEALSLVQQQLPLTAFVMWVESRHEAVALKCMEQGAAGYLLKEDPGRLEVTLKHALQGMQRRLDSEQNTQELKRIARIPEENPNPVLQVMGTGVIFYANSAARNILQAWNRSVGQELPNEWKRAVRSALETGTQQSMDLSIMDQTYSMMIVPIAGSGYVNLFGANITEHRRAQGQYQAIFEDSPVGIFQSTPGGRLISVNPGMARIFGYDSPTDMLRSVTDISTQIYAEAGQRRDFTQSLEASGTLQDYERKNIRKDGSTFWSSTTARVVRDTAGNVLYYEGFLQDITDRKHVEVEIQQRNDDLGLINSLNEAIGQGLGLDAVVDRLRAEIRRIFGGDGVAIYLLSADETSLVMQQYMLEPSLSKKLERLIGQPIPRVEVPVRKGGYFEEVLLSNKSRITSDPAVIQKWMGEFVETRFLPKMARGPIRKLIPAIFKVLNIKSTMLVPLVWEGRVIGLLDVSGPRVFTSEDLKRIESICGQLATVIHRHQMEEILRDERNLLRTLINNIPDRIYAMDAEGRKTLSNTADWKASGGRSMDDVIGRTDFDTYPPEMAEQFWEMDRHVLETGQPVINIEEPGLDGDGNLVSILTTKIPLHNEEGRVTGLVGVGRDITELKRTQARISDLLVFNEQILKNSPVGILTYKSTGECIFANEIAAAIVGTTVESLRSQNYHQLESWKKSGLYALIEKAIATKSVAMGDIHVITTYGKDVWLEARCITFMSNAEEHILLSALDITERKKMEETEHEQRTLAEALQGTAQLLNSTLDYGHVLNHILTSVGQVVAHDAATIMIIENGIGHVVRSRGYVERGLSDWIMGFELPIHETANLRRMHETGKPVIIPDTGTDPGWKVIPSTEWIRSNIGAPICTHGEVIGFILLDSQTTDFFSPVHAERLQLFADQAALAIQNSRLWQQAQDEIAERKRVEGELRESTDALNERVKELNCLFNIAELSNMPFHSGEELLQGIIELLPPGWQYPELTGVRLVLNDMIFQTAKFQETPWIQSSDILHAGERSGRLEISYAMEMPKEDEGPFLKEERFLLDTVARWISNLVERRQAEQSIRKEREKAQEYLDIAGVIMLALDQDGVVTLINQKGADVLGYPVHEIMGKRWIDNFIPVSLRDEMTTTLHTLLQGARPVEYYENAVLSRDGRERLIAWHNNLLRDADGTIIGTLSSGEDITERKYAEQELRNSEERFRQMADNIEEVFWLTDAETGREIYISPAAEKIWGVPVATFLNQPQAYLNGILPDDRAMVLAGIEQEKNGEKVELEYRVIRPDGSIRWIWDRAFPIKDEQGQVRTLAGISADITNRKLAEQALREKQEHFDRIARTIPGILYDYVYDPNGMERISYISPRCAEVLEVEAVEIMNDMQVLIQMIHPDDRVKFLESSAASDLHFNTETRIITPSGRLKWVHFASQLGSEDPHGVEMWSGVIHDVTDRKQVEEQLRTLSLAVEQSGSTIVITDPDGNIEYVNPQFTKTTGFTLEEAIGENPRILKTGHTSSEEYEELWDTITSGEQWRGELFNRKKNGETYWEQATISPIQNERGQITHYIAVKEDITHRKQSEMEIQRHLTELEALYENGLTIGRLLEPREIGNQIIQTFARHLSWHHVAIRLLDPETDELDLIAFNLPGLSAESMDEIALRFKTMVNRVGQGLSGWAMQTGEAIRTGNVSTHPQYVGTHEGIKSGLYMPLKVGGRVIGCISVESDQPDAFTQQDERLLATLATQAAIAFENARLYQAAQRELDERKRAQQALQASETHYRQLADSITDILFELDHDLRYTHWNKAYELFSGISASDAIGKSMREIWGDSPDTEYRENIYRTVLQQRQARIFEIDSELEGKQNLLEIHAYPSEHGVSVVARDITERRMLERLMQKRFELVEFSARHSLQEVLQRVIDEVSELTKSHVGFLHLVEADEVTIHLQAWSTETVQTYCHTQGQEMHYPLEQAGVWADAVRKRSSVIHNDYASVPDQKGLPEGHAEVIREMVVPVIRNDKVVAVMGVGNKDEDYSQQDLNIAERFADYAWDILERRRIENELAEERNQLAQRVEERTADLSRANSNLARALRVKDEFLANMSHELRTPLNAILGLSESLSEQVAGPLNEKQQKYLSTINESGHHLLSLINDILDLAKIEAGQITLDINKADINSICQASLRMIKQLSQRKNQQVDFVIDPDLGLMWADERRLKQMIVNLLSNAVKFTPESGHLGLEVHGSREENQVSISVWDQGIGISASNIQKLFKPFVQLDAGLAREASGTGLGLALVAEMARMHGGSVSVESQIGQGSRFTILLPWEPAMSGEVSQRLRITGKFQAIKPNEVRPTILLIEDTQEVIMMLMDYLEMNGFNVVTAQDGVDGLTQAKLAHPDLILMDVQMPRMDGFETTKKLRSDPEFRDTPIIALTALAMPNDREHCLQAGMNEYMSKPVNLKSLVKMIKTFLYGAENKEK